MGLSDFFGRFGPDELGGSNAKALPSGEYNRGAPIDRLLAAPLICLKAASFKRILEDWRLSKKCGWRRKRDIMPTDESGRGIMKIKAIKIVNYKGFSDTGYIELSDKWNVVVGQNNVGKTAFIESFRLSNISNNCPHRSLDIPKGAPFDLSSHFHVKMIVDRLWLRNKWFKQGGKFRLPVGLSIPNFRSEFINYKDFWLGSPIDMELEFSHHLVSSKWPSHNLFEHVADGNPVHVTFRSNSGVESGVVSDPTRGSEDDAPELVRSFFPDNIYVFDAKRFAVGQCVHEDTWKLAPDARNLPAVLMKMSGNPDLFRELNDNIKDIFPAVHGVTVTTKGPDFEIRIWTVDPATRRDDLSVPLNESGTGVGQVIAIIYVAMTNDPGVIAIDEPNSFLHPGAAKKLIQILKRYSQHQYIISTHSPEVIGEAQPATLHMIRLEGQRSVIQSFGSLEVETKRMMLEEVGASLSDVFSSESVIWVEGPTERECFSIIVNEYLSGPIVGLSFIALRNTGDIDGRHAAAALEIYDALTQGGSVLPVSICFSFDKEGKSNKQIDDIKRRCDGKAYFLPRRMTENYLLDCGAIARVLNAIGEKDISESDVESAMRLLYRSHMPKEISSDYGSRVFFENVDGARLLNDVFEHLTDSRNRYRKIQHGSDILREIISSDRESLTEIVDFVRSLVSSFRK